MTVPNSELKPLVSTRHLAHLLGIKRDELRSLADSAEQLYRPFRLIKEHREGGPPKWREIDNPLPQLKICQRLIKQRLLDCVSLPAFMFGGVRGRSSRSNARIHIQQPVVVTLDVKDFFPSVRPAHVAGVWRRVFKASTDVAWLLTRLTTFQGRLPQGSPASLSLANLVLLPIVTKMETLCTEHGLRISVYVDDITISGQCPEAILNNLIKLLSQGGFSVRRDKVKVMPASTSQRVTGCVVNRRVSNPKERLNAARQQTQALIEGRLTPRQVNSLRGTVSYISTTNPNQGRWFRKQLEQSGGPKAIGLSRAQKA